MAKQMIEIGSMYIERNYADMGDGQVTATSGGGPVIRLVAGREYIPHGWHWYDQTTKLKRAKAYLRARGLTQKVNFLGEPQRAIRKLNEKIEVEQDHWFVRLCRKISRLLTG